MGGIPLPALDLQPTQAVSPLQEYAKVQQLRTQAQQQQLQQQELQQNQSQMQDQQKLRELAPNYIKKDESGKPVGFDSESYYRDALASGVSPKTVNALQLQQADATEKLAQSKKSGFEYQNSVNNQLYGMLEDVRKSGNPAQKQQAYQQVLFKAKQVGADTSQFPPQYPGDEQIPHFEAALGVHAQVLSDAKTLAETQEITGKAELDAQKQVEDERHNKAMESKVPITEAELASKAAAGDPLAEAALKRLDKSKLASRPVNNIMTGNDAKDIADAIENGDQPPTLQGLYRNAGPVRAELARRGVPLAKMETDWKATQRFMMTLNGPQQTRMRQAISTASDSLDKIDSLYKEFHSVVGDGQFRLLNKATLAASKQLPGRAGALATALDAQIADVTAELGNVYMGGNSPTDHSLGLAAKNLSSDWNRETFEEALKQAHANIKIRENSILHAQPAGVGADSPYSPPQQSGGSSGGMVTMKAPNGQTRQVSPDQVEHYKSLGATVVQ